MGPLPAAHAARDGRHRGRAAASHAARAGGLHDRVHGPPDPRPARDGELVREHAAQPGGVLPELRHGCERAQLEHLRGPLRRALRPRRGGRGDGRRRGRRPGGGAQAAEAAALGAGRRDADRALAHGRERPRAPSQARPAHARAQHEAQERRLGAGGHAGQRGRRQRHPQRAESHADGIERKEDATGVRPERGDEVAQGRQPPLPSKLKGGQFKRRWRKRRPRRAQPQRVELGFRLGGDD
mmetsp:Transcript_16401/g.50184  ORF Transcript_16401/g.50184 Transcript_16401/m.50184 type:complete len:240 (+) Transcript_16401:2719-3438(+)